MRKITLLLLFLSSSILAFSTHVTPEEARQVATNFLLEKGYILKDSKNLSLLSEAKSEKPTLLYKFNIEDQGFVIISGTKATFPVLAYSFAGNFESQPAVDFWLDNYEKQLTEEAKNSAVWEHVPAQWDYYLAETFVPQSSKESLTVAPLLTSLWDQSKYYNTYCPWDAGASAYYDYRVPNGCVALAMAQIMYYYRFPETGVGGVSYEPSPYPRQIVKFYEHTYNYDAMEDQLNSYNGEVAKLIYHAGVACKMGYSADGSGAYTEAAVRKMGEHFNYNPSARMITQSEFLDAMVKYYVRLLVVELQEKRPILYSGYPSGGGSGHAFILDGVDADTLFHVNWGWGGAANGYFRFNMLKPGSSDYSSSTQAFQKLHPKDAVSPTLSGHDRHTATKGTVSSYNMYLPYNPNPDKTWMLAAPLAATYQIKINKWDISPDDQLIIYNGPTVESGEKVVLNSSHIGQTITVTADSVLIALKSNGTAVENDAYHGFHISYNTILNPEPTSLTHQLNWQVHENLVPEMSNGTYLPEQEVTWILSPNFTNGFTFSIHDFDLRAGDFIDVYNATTYPATLWKRFDIYNPPTNPYSVDFTKMKVVFVADNWLEGTGFRFDYWTILGVCDQEGELENISIYPNPATSYVHLDFYTENSGNISLKIYDLTGKLMNSNSFPHTGGEFSQTIPVDHLAAGMYILHIETNKGKVIRKLTVN